MYSEISADLIDAPEKGLRREITAEEVRLLGESIREVGLLQPLGVVAESGRYRVRYGHRRLLACQWIGLDPIPCVVVEGDNSTKETIAAAENIVRRDLSPVEEAQAIRSLIDGRGYSVEEVARSVGRSCSWVRLRLELLRWPRDFVEAIERGDVNMAVARELVWIEDEGVRAHYLRCAVESGCTGAQAKIWRREWEVSSACTWDGDPVRGVPPPVVQPGVPRAPCGVCEMPNPVTSLGFLRICAGCAATLEGTKRANEVLEETGQASGADGVGDGGESREG